MMQKGKIKISIIGAGMFGGSVVKVGSELDIPGIILNASSDDIQSLMIDNNEFVTAFVVGDGRGTGKNRDIARQFLLEHSTIFEDAKFTSTIDESDVIIVAGSAGGGFGSGSVPTIVEILRKLYPLELYPEKTFIPLTVLPDTSEVLIAQDHSKAFLRDILKQEVPYIIYDNEKFKGDQSNVVYEKILATIKQDLRILRGDYIIGVKKSGDGSNMDPRDLLTVISVPGRICLGLSEPFKKNDSKTPIDTMKALMDESAHAEIENDKVVIASAVMYNLSEESLESCNGERISSEMTEIFGVRVGDYKNEVTYDGIGNQFMSVIVTGLSAPNTRINQIIDIFKKRDNVLISRQQSTNNLFADDNELSSNVRLGARSLPNNTSEASKLKKPDLASIMKDYLGK